MKKVFALSFSVIFILSLVVICFAHPGRTDSDGGHYNRDTGEYHYHHGYSAHQHDYGECPYETTKLRLETDPPTTKEYTYTTEAETEKATKENNFSFIKDFVVPVIKWLFGIIFVIFIICMIPVIATAYNEIKNEFKK